LNNELSQDDISLLRALQEDFKVSKRPFLEIAEALDWTEQEVITRTRKLVDSGMIRKLGAVIAHRKMGYVSMLAAIDVPPEHVEEKAKVINEFNGVTHNYLREGHPNIWFTLTEADEQTLDKHLQDIEKRVGTKINRMPAIKMFKIGVKLDI
jgi:DNA-binding Lrp family transcriptional regulator